MNKPHFLLILPIISFFLIHCNQSKNIMDIHIQGNYLLYEGIPKYDYNWLGTLSIKNDNYSFAFQNTYPISDLDKDKYSPKFPFLAKPEGKYTITYEKGIPGIDSLPNNTTIARIRFGQDSNSTYLMKIDSDENKIYFHSTVSELQTFSLSKPLSGILTTEEALKIADKEFVAHLKEYNKTEESKELGGPFLMDGYNKKVKPRVTNKGTSYYIYYYYTFPNSTGPIISGGPALIIIIVNPDKTIRIVPGE